MFLYFFVQLFKWLEPKHNDAKLFDTQNGAIPEMDKTRPFKLDMGKPK